MRATQISAAPLAEKPEAPVVFVVDDDPSIRSSISRLLRGAGYNVQTFATASQLFESGRPRGPCCLILDVEMPDVNGLEFRQAMDRAGLRVPTIFITGYGSIPMGVGAMKAGALDFLP